MPKDDDDRLLSECRHNRTRNLPGRIGQLVDVERVDVGAVDSSGRNALHLLCIHNQTEYLLDGIEQLLWRGLDVNSVDSDGRNALHLLCAHNSTGLLSEIIYVFRHHGVDLNAADRDGRTALHLLCANLTSVRCSRAARDGNLQWICSYYLHKWPEDKEGLRLILRNKIHIDDDRDEEVFLSRGYLKKPLDASCWRFEYLLRRGSTMDDWLDLTDPKRSLPNVLVALKGIDANALDKDGKKAIQLV